MSFKAHRFYLKTLNVLDLVFTKLFININNQTEPNKSDMGGRDGQEPQTGQDLCTAFAQNYLYMHNI